MNYDIIIKNFFEVFHMAEKKKIKTKPVWDVFDIAEIFVLCTACIVIVFSLLVRMTVVSGRSMETTLLDGEYLLVSDFMYKPERGDIVVVNDPTKTSIYSEPLVKRVIGVPGDTLEIKNGKLYLNGEGPIDESSYIREDMSAGTNTNPIVLAEHQYFIMGDNRNESGDSRLFGPIDERCIIGKAFVRVFPFNKFSFTTNPIK